MYIPDETVVQLYKMIGEIPTKYGAKPAAILAEVIVNNDKSKAAKEAEIKEGEQKK